MANTIYWTSWMEQLHKQITQVGKYQKLLHDDLKDLFQLKWVNDSVILWHGKMRLMGKSYSWASWGSVSQRLKHAERWTGKLRQAGVCGREHGPVIESWHSHRFQMVAWGQSARQETIKCPFHCSTCKQGENSSPILLCHSLFLQSTLES